MTNHFEKEHLYFVLRHESTRTIISTLVSLATPLAMYKTLKSQYLLVVVVQKISIRLNTLEKKVWVKVSRVFHPCLDIWWHMSRQAAPSRTMDWVTIQCGSSNRQSCINVIVCWSWLYMINSGTISVYTSVQETVPHATWLDCPLSNPFYGWYVMNCQRFMVQEMIGLAHSENHVMAFPLSHC